MAEPAYSITQPVAPSVPICPMMARMMSFAVTPVGSLPSTEMRKVFGLRLRQRLRGQHVLHFAGADAERQRAERAVGRGVRVAADDGHAGLGDAELRPDHVHDALLARVHVVELDAEVGAVLAQRGDLRGGDLVDDMQPAFNGGRDVVIHRGDGAVGPAHLAAGQAKALESLRGRDLVDQLQVDVEQRGLAFGLDDDVLLPDLFE